MSNQLIRRGDKFDKFRAHILESRKLKPEDLQMLARYRKSVAMLGIGYSRQNVVMALKGDPTDPLSESQAYNIVRDSMKLFGSIDDVDKDGLRFIAHENYKALARAATKDGNHAAAIRAQENADRLYDLFNADVVKQDPNLFLVPVPICFSSDEAVLLAQQKGLEQNNIQDVEYEEAE